MTEIRKLADTRINEDMLAEVRSHRTHRFSEWKKRIDDVDALYRGDWEKVFPDENVEVDLPNVMNLVQTAMDDMAKLISEAQPSVRCFPNSDRDADQENAYLREGIAETYGVVNNWEVMRARLGMDLAGAGAAFVVVLEDPESLYPCYHRIDPRMAYPDTHNGVLQDLLVHQSMKVRQAARLFPQLQLTARYREPDIADSAEVIEYYNDMEAVQAVIMTKSGKPIPGGTEIVKRWKHGLHKVPVAFVQLDSFDGDFRGMFDQVAGSLKVKNRIFQLMLDYTDQLVYAPPVSKGLLNPDEELGPNAHFRLDPNVPDAGITRLAPAGSSPDVWRLLEYLDREQRGALTYPATRQGEISQSIASASFVNSTMGALTSTVRNIQRLLAVLQEQVIEIAFCVDAKRLDFEKPLSRPVGKRKVYTPSRAIGERYENQVIYGAGAGLDRLNADVRILQHLGAGLISRETAREHIDYLPQDGEENDRVEHEMARSALAQKFLTEAPWNLVAEVVKKMEDEGAPLSKAIKEVMEQQQPETGAAPQGVPGPAPQGESAMTEQLALAKGRTEQTQTAPKFLPEPLTNILVRPGSR